MMTPILVSEKKVTGIDSLDGLHEHAVSVAEGLFASQHYAPQRWLLRIGRKRLVTIDTPWDGEASKDVGALIMRLLIQVLEVEAYTFLHEAWMAVQREGGPPLPDKLPSEMDPEDREDVLMLNTVGRDGSGRWTRYGVVHAGTKKSRLLARDDWQEERVIAGRLSNLFLPPRGVWTTKVGGVRVDEPRTPPKMDEEAMAFIRRYAAALSVDEVIKHMTNVANRMRAGE